MIIGLTGGIATGKSTVSDYLKKQGFIVIDADELSRNALTIDQVCINKVLTLFDCADENGKIDRKKLGNIIFNNKEAQAKLESIVHPYVINKMQESIVLAQAPFIFLDIPLLYEAHLEYLCDFIVVVDVDEEIQIQRLLARNHFTLEEAMARIRAQMPLTIKVAKADYVIHNNLSPADLYQQLEVFIALLKKGELPWANY